MRLLGFLTASHTSQTGYCRRLLVKRPRGRDQKKLQEKLASHQEKVDQQQKTFLAICTPLQPITNGKTAPSPFSRPNEKLNFHPQIPSLPNPAHTEADSLIHPLVVNQAIGQAGLPSCTRETQGCSKPAARISVGRGDADLTFPSIVPFPQLLELPNQWHLQGRAKS